MKKILLAAVLAAVGLAMAIPAWLMLSPSPIDPEAWTPPVAPKLEGAYAENSILKNVQRLAVGAGVGPEGIAVDGEGRVYAGYGDGRIVRIAADGASYVELGNTGGVPLGIGFDPNGGLVICDARRGLMHLATDPGAKPQAEIVSAVVDNIAVGFADDVDSAKSGKEVFFSDASSKFPFPFYNKDVLEHRPNGRLIAYNVETRASRVLLPALYFANGVAVGPDDAYVLVTETSAYRVTRYWLKGEKAGTQDIFIGNLPGMPDNISFNGRDRFWLALPGLRDRTLDGLAGWPLLRKLIARLPGRVQGWLQPAPKKHSFVLGLDLDGKLVANLQYAGDDAYAPITSVEEQGPWLYFGSLSEPSIARLPLQAVLPDSPAPPTGWEQAPSSAEAVARSAQ